MPKEQPLTNESLGHLNYLHSILTQPLGRWDGFYTPQSPSMNFALRYQLAFASYAVALLSQSTPAYRAPYASALNAAIEKMLHIASWDYWRAPSTGDTGSTAHQLTSSGHMALLVSPHTRAPLGPPSDPIAQDNLQYSGHLSAMLGLYEKVSGDHRYDAPFTLHDPESGASYTYTHSEVAARIHDQMRENSFGGVCCERGMAYVPCNNYALASNTLHDALHATRYSRANLRWLRTVRDKMVLKVPTVRGIFGAAYLQDANLAAPVAFQFTDAWGLAFLLPFAPSLVARLYPAFRKRVTHAGKDGAYVSSSQVSERIEISDTPINTGFGLILARGMGDRSLTTALSRYAKAHFNATWQGHNYLYAGAPRTLHSTALYALAEVVSPGGHNFTHLFTAPPDPLASQRPHLAHISPYLGPIGVSRAEWLADGRSLYIELVQIGSPSRLTEMSPVDVTLTIRGLTMSPTIAVDDTPLPENASTPLSDGSLRFTATVYPSAPTSCIVKT